MDYELVCDTFTDDLRWESASSGKYTLQIDSGDNLRWAINLVGSELTINSTTDELRWV